MARLLTQRAVIGTLALVGVWSLAVPLAGCRGDRADARPRRILPDMDLQPKWKPQTETEFFVMQDGSARTQRVPDPNVIAFGRRSFDPAVYAAEPWAAGYMTERDSFLADDDRFYKGIDGGPEDFLDYMPVEITPELLALGQAKYNITCAACHGQNGEGNLAMNAPRQPSVTTSSATTGPPSAGLFNITDYCHRVNSQFTDLCWKHGCFIQCCYFILYTLNLDIPESRCMSYTDT